MAKGREYKIPRYAAVLAALMLALFLGVGVTVPLENPDLYEKMGTTLFHHFLS